jgi:hypothetical protein
LIGKYPLEYSFGGDIGPTPIIGLIFSGFRKEVEGARKVAEVLYIQVDGTGLNDRASGQWMACKVGVRFSEQMKVSKDRVWLVEKRSYASIEGVEAFGEKFFLDCVKQWVLEAKRVIFIGDGASGEGVEADLWGGEEGCCGGLEGISHRGKGQGDSSAVTGGGLQR